jgi:ATP-binding cassette subfamily B protein
MFLALVSAERVLEILKKVEESDDENALEMKKIKGEIKAVNLNFQYVPDKKILKNVNFLIKPGKTTAIVGPTGGGKSTIISLITRFYNVTSGDLLLDDTPIKNIKLKSLRKNIAMIPQDTFLFNDTIFENIRYGNIDATNDEIIKAAKATQANNFIEKMSKKYETRLDDNAITLSQGQKQLIAITRAFLSKAKIIILDEATSSVDSDTELKIEEAIKRVSKNKTTIVIAHRLSTIKNADNILVVKDGKIFEQGNHKQLLKKNGFYAKLYNSQFTTGNIEDK